MTVITVVSAFLMNSRIISFDFVRGIACLMVLGIHVLQAWNVNSNGGMPENMIYFLMTPCDGLFLMITGCLLLRDSALPLSFFLRRAVDVYMPVALVSLLIMLCGFSPGIEQHQNVISIFWKPVWPSYWFFYALLGVYLLVVPMNRLYRRFGKQFLSCATVAWLIEIGALLGLVIMGQGSVLLDIVGEIPVLLSILFWGFLPLGKYIWLMFGNRCMHKVVIAVAVVMLLGIGGIVYYVKSPLLHEFLFQNYLSPLSICLTGCAFYFLLKCRDTISHTSWIEFLGRHSLWFCLLHVLPWVLWRQP